MRVGTRPDTGCVCLRELMYGNVCERLSLADFSRQGETPRNEITNPRGLRYANCRSIAFVLVAITRMKSIEAGNNSRRRRKGSEIDITTDIKAFQLDLVIRIESRLVYTYTARIS